MLCLVAQSCLTLCDSMDYSLPSSSVHGDSPGKNTGLGCYPPPEDLPNPGVEPSSPTLQADSWPAESRGKPTKHGRNLFSLSSGGQESKMKVWAGPSSLWGVGEAPSCFLWPLQPRLAVSLLWPLPPSPASVLPGCVVKCPPASLREGHLSLDSEPPA